MKLKNIFPATGNKVRIEFRLFEITLVLTILVVLFWSVFAFAADYILPIKLIYVSCLVLYSLIYYAQKKKLSFTFLATAYYGLAFLMLAFAWLPSGGVTGAILHFFVLIFISGLLVLPLRAYLLFIAATAILVVNFSVYEMYYPEGAVHYVNKVNRIRDISIAGTITIGVLGFALFTFKRAFLADRENLKKAIEKIEIEKEKAESADKAKSQFLATISHEMRTPLNGIIGISELLTDTKLNNDQKEMVKNLRYSGKLLHSLISDLLDLTVIEDGKLGLQKNEIRLDVEIRDVLDIFKTNIDSKKEQVEVSYQHDFNIPILVYGDVTRFRQILVNLVNNAVKFTDKGSIRVRSEVLSTTDSMIDIRFLITDTGSGIPIADQKHIFTKFFRSDNNSKIEGTGLGLSISKSIVEYLGGSIGFESEPGKGSTFFFNLPFSHAPIDPSKPSANQKDEIERRSLKILIAEDDMVNQLVLSKTLSKLNITNIDIVENGEEAVKKAKEEFYDFILIDIQMPILGGVEASKEILKFYEGKRKPKIIAVTANVMKSDQDMYLGIGMCDVLGKPFKIEMLKEVLHRNLDT